MSFLPNYKKLFDQCNDQSLILTPNRRLSRFITALHCEYQVANSASVWASLKCMSLSDWLVQQWHKVQASGLSSRANMTTISPLQSQALWERVIRLDRSEAAGDGFEGDAPAVNAVGSDISNESLAMLANDAWTTLGQWRLDLSDLPQDFDGVSLLNRWGRRFQKELDKKNWLDAESYMATLIDLIAEDKLPLPSSVWCLGFDNHSPLVDKLFHVLSEHCPLSTYEVSLDATVKKVPVLNPDQELEYAARWAEQQVKKGLTVAVVVPSLAQNKEQVELVFNRVFHPQSWNPHQARQAPGFNISAAQQLIDTPIMACAVDVLSLNRHELGLDTVRRIINSPFWGDESEQVSRAFFYEHLASKYEKISPKKLRSELAHFNESFQPYDCSVFYRQLDAFLDLKRVAPRLGAVRQWLQLFEKQVSALAWPGERKLDTLEYQQLQDWPKIAQNMLSLADLDQSIPFEQAYAYLKKAAKIPFHAQTQNSPVQVLGLLEAAGMQFDAMWVTQMTDLDWPEPLKQNPLLPAHWQRQHLMPRSCSERELSYAKALTKRLSMSAHHVIFSWSQWLGDEPIKQSPLIECFDEASIEQLLDDCDKPLHLMNQQIVSLEKLIDDKALPLDDAETISGGTAILTNQSACPFRAFAIHRLEANASEEFIFGISALDRGIFVHAVMDLLWRNIKTHENLCALSTDELIHTVRSAAEHAWQSSMKKIVGRRLKRIELERTEQVVLAWLALEKKRESFVVLEREKKINLSLAGLPLSLRIDRVDQLSDAETLAVIDYKTGMVNYKKWQGDRPEEPQVPLYALADKQVGAAVFASLKKGQDMKFSGIADNTELFTALVSVGNLNPESWPSNWADLVERWQSVLTEIAQEFMQGYAAVSPKDNMSCMYCNLHSLCRIQDSGGGKQRALDQERLVNGHNQLVQKGNHSEQT